MAYGKNVLFLSLWVLQVGFTGNYSEYFGFATDVDAVVYLMLVNDMIHGLYPEAVTIGEDVCFLNSSLSDLACIHSLVLRGGKL